MKTPTIEDHLNNIVFAIKKATMTGEEHQAILTSYLQIRNALLPKPEDKQATPTEEVIKP